jgi:ligand-binding sensor domain-containing protein/class 3 adenylate cyclase
MKLICTVFLFVFCFLGSPYGQMAYRFRNYTINDGLSQSSVTCIVQGELNALWIGTQDGLNRFDGIQFENYTSDDTPGLENEFIHCSAKTADGQMWFGTNNGLSSYNPNTESFSTFNIKKTAPLQVENIAIDYEGNIWLSSSSNGLLYFDTHTLKFVSHKLHVPSKKLQNVFTSSKGILFVSTEDKGILLYEKNGRIPKKINVPSKVSIPVIVEKVAEWEEHKILFCTNQGVFEYNLSTEKTHLKFLNLLDEFGDFGATDVYLSNEGTWFVATKNKGLFTILKDGFMFQSSEDIFQKNALSFNEINVLFKDQAGTFWVGTERGLGSFDPRNKGFLGVGPSGNLELGIPTPSVWCFGEDSESKYTFVGTDSGISRYNRKSGKFEQYYRNKKGSKGLDNQAASVLSMHVLDKNNVLAGCVDGLFLLTINESGSYVFNDVKVFSNKESLGHAKIYSIVKWKGDKFFLGTKNGVVLYDLKTQKTVVFENDSSRPNETISFGICRLVYKDQNGRMWFATSSGGLNVFDESSQKIKPYSSNTVITSLTKDYITSIYQNGDVFWMGTFGSGLMKWDIKKKKGKLFNKKQGLPNDVIYAVLSDQSGKLWLSSNKGISCFDPLTLELQNYSEVHGLMSNEFNLGASMKSRTNHLFFGGIYGYNYFDPLTLSEYNPDITVQFTKFKLDKSWLKPNEEGSPLLKTISKTDNLELRYKQRSFTLQFAPSDLSNPELIEYKYILEGSDEGEMFIGTVNELRFNSLSPGEYTLKLYARLGNRRWSVSPATLSIQIIAPFWATWWFWTIVGVMLLIFTRWFVRQRIELERREQVRLEMKIAERTREIRNQKSQIEAQKKLIEDKKNKLEQQQKLLQMEKDKSEKLLRKIIPESTVEDLKNNGKTSARAYKTVSVLFTDFVGFTKIAEVMSPTDLVTKLDIYFRKFDEIIVKNNLEKIKTIGDAYMCAGGVPVRNTTNPIDTCLAALQIQDYMSDLKREGLAKNEEYWSLRLGINTGEVTAGVIGSERLAYDIWGATVNQAQRMEMLGEPGKVTITGNTFNLIEPYFECVFRGKAQSKSRGLIDMYTIERVKPELSVDGKGIYPNDKFQQIVNLHHYSSINYYKAERHIMNVLTKRLSPKLHYHCIDHTSDVVRAVEHIALTENVTDEGLFLLKTAASYHDAGFVEAYEKNEPVGARLAEEILPTYGYSKKHIDLIKELIFVTEIPHKPKNKLEEIICDADLDYLGRDDFHEIADRLRLELREHGKINSDRLWDEIQVDFLTSHRYFTKTSIDARRKKKLKHLEEIKEKLKRNEYVD